MFCKRKIYIFIALAHFIRNALVWSELTGVCNNAVNLLWQHHLKVTFVESFFLCFFVCELKMHIFKTLAGRQKQNFTNVMLP